MINYKRNHGLQVRANGGVQFYLLVLFTFFLVGCNKEKPKVGNYNGYFWYDTPSGAVKYADINISVTTDDVVIMNGYELQKDGKKIEGELPFAGITVQGVYIKGKWSKKLFSKDYVIEGSFVEKFSQGGQEYTYTGKFEIKSD